MKDNANADKFRKEGNDFYQKNEFYKALISYNKSLCHAMPQSSQLGLAYANRSAIYLKLKQFDKCLDNIQLARNNNYPNEAKLVEREMKSQEQLKTQQPDPKNDPWTYFKLSYAANDRIPSIVACLDVRTDEKYGRHIITNKNLKSGDVIAIENPIFKVPVKNAWNTKCSFCLKSNMLNLIPCNFENDANVCSSAMYCDQECLIKARDRFHGAFCRDHDLYESWAFVATGLLESLSIVERPDILRSLMNCNKQKTIFNFDLRNEQDNPIADLKSLLIFNNLEMDSDQTKEAHYKQTIPLIVKTIPKLKTLCDQDPKMETLLVDYLTRHVKIRNRNSIGFEDQGEKVGSVVLPFASLYSHSCDTNIFIVCIDNKFVHIVLKPVKKGEQLFFNYGFNLGAQPDRVQRQEAIMKRFTFKCSCVACLNNYSLKSLPRYAPNFVLPDTKLPGTIEDSMIELKKRFKYINKNSKNYPSMELFDSILRCQELLTSIRKKSQWPYAV